MTDTRILGERGEREERGPTGPRGSEGAYGADRIDRTHGVDGADRIDRTHGADRPHGTDGSRRIDRPHRADGQHRSHEPAQILEPVGRFDDGNDLPSDPGISLGGATVNSLFVNYPAASPITFVSFAANVSAPVPVGAVVNVQLFKNGVAVATFLITYGAGEVGVKTAPAPTPVSYAVGDSFYVSTQFTGFTVGESFQVSTTFGVR